MCKQGKGVKRGPEIPYFVNSCGCGKEVKKGKKNSKKTLRVRAKSAPLNSRHQELVSRAALVTWPEHCFTTAIFLGTCFFLALHAILCPFLLNKASQQRKRIEYGHDTKPTFSLIVDTNETALSKIQSYFCPQITALPVARNAKGKT